jgi:uncharacterized protein YggU (UPF0235/DUF167 family)
MGWTTSERNELCLRVSAPPEGGKANEAVIRLLAKSLGIAKSNIKLLRGQTSRHKLLALSTDEADFDVWVARLPVL